MKIIKSLGGPLIGLDRDHMHLWTGTDGKGFVGEMSPFPSDYEAAGDLTCGRSHPPCRIAKIKGIAADGILITMPLQTAVIAADGKSIYIAQVEYADEDWRMSMISTNDFDKALLNTNDDVRFASKACTYVFFDAAYPGNEINDDWISFELNEGQHTFSSALLQPDESLGLILCKISTD